MGVGRFIHYLRVRVPTLTDDGEGGQSPSWADGEALWANVEGISAREQAVVGALQKVATHRVTMHYTSDVTTDRRLARVAPEGSELQILGVRDKDGRQRWLEVDCAEVVADG